MSDDSRAAFLGWWQRHYGDVLFGNDAAVKDVAHYAWNAAIAWATVRHEAEKRRLVEWLIKPMAFNHLTGQPHVRAHMGTPEEILAAFNAAEQENRG